MNRVELIGRLTKDPEVNKTSSGKEVCSFTIAVPRIGKGETDFIDCTVWGVQANNLALFQHKGSQIAVSGRLTKRSYDDKQGQKRWVTEVIAESIDYLSSRSESGTQNQKPSDVVLYNNEFEEPSSFDITEDDIQF